MGEARTQCKLLGASGEEFAPWQAEPDSRANPLHGATDRAQRGAAAPNGARVILPKSVIFFETSPFGDT